MKSMLRNLCPPLFWTGLKRVFPSLVTPPPTTYQGVVTQHNMRALHNGRFADIYEQGCHLDPHVPPNTMRLRIYHLCLLATIAKAVLGDFLTAGISYGVSPWVMYEFLRFPTLGKRWHFVDAFTGVNAEGNTALTYNTDMNIVKQRYAVDAPLMYHQLLLPKELPIPGVKQLAFVHLNLSNWHVDAACLPYLWEHLSPGGIIVMDSFAFGRGNQEAYTSVLTRLAIEPFTLVTGQGVLIKT